MTGQASVLPGMVYRHQSQMGVAAPIPLSADDLEPVPIGIRRQKAHQSQSKRRSRPTHNAFQPNDLSLYFPTSTPSIASMPSHDHGKSNQPENSMGWLDDLKLEISGLSLEPMSGTEVLTRIRNKTDDVITRYLPCVEFLVSCQQELRKGLAIATQKRLVRGGHSYRNVMSPRQFYGTYIEPLSDKFYRKNMQIMKPQHLRDALQEIKKICGDARKAERQGCEAIKNNFLGGMKDGESWGLRKWLSKHGSALYICTDLECIVRECQNLDRGLETTKKLAEMMRPLAQQALNKLKSDVPASYQEVSTAHPYLPFFHRLESALKTMANFDPEDDDVICIDDEDEIAEAKAKAAAKTDSKVSAETQKKRKSSDDISQCSKGERSEEKEASVSTGRHQHKKAKNEVFSAKGVNEKAAGAHEDDDSVIEIVGIKPAGKAQGQSDSAADQWTCCNNRYPSHVNECATCGDLKDSIADFSSLVGLEEIMKGELGAELDSLEIDFSVPDSRRSTPQIERKQELNCSLVDAAQCLMVESQNLSERVSLVTDAMSMAKKLVELANIFEQNQQDSVRPMASYGTFWDGIRYAKALRLFVTILQSPESPPYVNRVDEDGLVKEGQTPYSYVIKNPLCFRDIVESLVLDNSDSYGAPLGSDGKLPPMGLSFWNMWQGSDLLQAIDLVFLNSLAYAKVAEEGRATQRAQTNRLRKTFWNGINQIIEQHVGSNNEMRKQCTPTRRGESSGFVIRKRRS